MTNIPTTNTILTPTENKVLHTMSNGHLRVAVVGNVDSGKSTLIGTLVSSTLDNGKGANRTKVARHKHEAESGRTSSVSTHLMGFDADGNVIPNTAARFDEADMVQKATRVVSLMDLAGHEKYLRTTVGGLCKGMADYALVLVSASQPPTSMTMKHLNLCISLNIPVVIVLTKSDASPSHVFRSTKKAVHEALRSVNSSARPYDVKSMADIDIVQDKMHCLAPIITTSCVSGEGLDILHKMLFVLPKRRHHVTKIDRPFEFLLEDTFVVTGVGLVLSGFVNAGQWNKGDVLYIGPMSDGTYIKTIAKTAHVARTPVKHCWAGHSVCFAVTVTKEQRKMIVKRKGIVAIKELVPSTKTVTAELYILKGQQPVTMIVGSYRTTAHVLHMKRPVSLVSAHTAGGATGAGRCCRPLTVIRPGERVIVTLKFSHAEYLRKGMRIVLREGLVNAIGVVLDTTTTTNVG